MKNYPVILRWAALLTFAFGSVSCMTTYDSAGRPVQSVDPALAVAGVAAAGLVGYSIANNRDDRRYHQNRSHHRNYYYQPRHYGHPRHYY